MPMSSDTCPVALQDESYTVTVTVRVILLPIVTHYYGSQVLHHQLLVKCLVKWTQILYQKALARLNDNADKALDAELQGECSTVSQSLNDSWVTRRSKKRRPVSSSSDDELENKNRTP